MKTRPLVTFLLFAASTTFAASPSPISTASPSPSPSATAAQPRNLKPEDYAGLRDVDEPNLSPDGNLVVYVVKAADMEKDKMPGNLWLAKWDGGRFVDRSQACAAKWSLTINKNGFVSKS